MRVSDIHGRGTYLRATDLQPLGQRRTVIAHGVALEHVGAEQKQALVLDLVTSSGKAWPKSLTLNKSNATQLQSAYGDDTDKWTGKVIEIWSENVQFQGRVVPGIKVSPTAARAAGNGANTPPPRQRDQLDDEIPF
jgi:hypothetical protein